MNRIRQAQAEAVREALNRIQRRLHDHVGHGPFCAKPVRPSLIPRIPARYTATISRHEGWWFRYRVDRLHGVFIPECSYSGHRTLKGAQRAAARWTRRNDRSATTTLERYP